MSVENFIAALTAERQRLIAELYSCTDVKRRHQLKRKIKLVGRDSARAQSKGVPKWR